MSYAQIALPLPLEDFYDYWIPPELASRISVGMRVRVPFGRRMITGFCVGMAEQSHVPADKIKEISDLIDNKPVVDDRMIAFARWWAAYYQCSLGEALDASVPSETKESHTSGNYMISLASPETVEESIAQLQEKYPLQARVLRFLKECQMPVEREEMRRKLKISLSPIKTLMQKNSILCSFQENSPDPFYNCPTLPPRAVMLTAMQKQSLEGITKAMEEEKFQTFLLLGVTGSGKTEVYLQAMERAIAKGKESIVLVPEIALTPQTVTRFKQRFPKVAVLHSALTPAQRAYQWKQIDSGQIQVVIGPRSAIFAPVHKLGLIVVDEEHEPSFKQQNTPRYHARDIAVKRAQMENAIVILGSATPSLESYYNGLQKKYHIFYLPQRIGTAKLPKIFAIDMREECREQKKFVYFSRPLIRSLEKVLQAQEQAILFLNRRGFATTVNCPACGYELKCQHCEISLTYHKKKKQALCHYCGYEAQAPDDCPVCHFQGIRFLGAGTERIESILKATFPNARIRRMDSDTMISRHHYEEALQDFSDGKIDILLGTQMIAKGLDFPKVTLVGILSADSGLQLPDFRAAERTFQLSVQVAGRAGRGEKPGVVILQSWNPAHYAIQASLSQDYEKFAKIEMEFRKQTQYPPFGKIIRFIIEGQDEKAVKEKAQEIAKKAKESSTCVIGPAPAPISKIKDKYRWHFILKASKSSEILQSAKALKNFITTTKSIKVQMDIDPISLL
ncbi:MAG: primosomal protein N' [Candidatus Brocadiae bacterium]|nr:primosomal protein N' [Candidatus Brocadiia bacterium]